jgi:nitrite reductase/ring-hydroxylating ferredoxin subunit
MAEQVRIAELATLERDEPVCVEHAGVPYVIIKTKDGIQAFVSVCSHKELAMFPPRFKKGCLVCPYHKVAFDAQTGSVVDDQGKHVPLGLAQVQTEEIEGVLYLKAKKKQRRRVPKAVRKWVKKAVKQRSRQERH